MTNSAAAPRPNPTRSLVILSTAALAYALAQTTIIPALGILQERLHTNSSGIAWILSAYLLSAAVFTPIFGRLGDMFGKRRMLVVSLSAFVLGSIVAALATSLEVVVAGRVLQGIGGGVFPLCFGIVRDEFPREKVGTSIGFISATLGIGGGFGLLVGGLIADHASPHWIFWLSAIMSSIATVCVQLFIRESPERSPGTVDYRGAFVLGIGLVLPLFAVSRANVWGWGSPKVIVPVVVGAVILALWVRLQKRTTHPIADMETLRRPPVLLTNLTTLLVGFGMFGTFILVPQLLEAPRSTGYGFALSATSTGLIMLPSALAMFFMGPVSGMLGARFGNRVPLALGAVILAVSLLALGFAHGSEAVILLLTLVAGIGIALAYAAMPNLIVDAVEPSRTGEATGFNAVVRSVGSSLGSQLTAAVLAGSVVASTGFPSDSAFRIAFILSAVVAGISAVLAYFIPPASHGHLPAAVEAAAAAPLGEPSYAGGVVK